MLSVSVILPVYNAASTVRRAINSILNQTLSNLELIIVNDGSTDGSSEIINSFSDERICVHSVAHQGVAAATNLGTRHAKAPLIARMDSDDFAHPERLFLQVERLRKDELDVVGSQVQILTEDDVPAPGLQRYERWINEETLQPSDIAALRFVEFPLVNPSILARREYFEMGFRDGEYPEDYDLMLRAANSGFRFGKVPQPLLTWYDSPERLTRTATAYSREAFMACRRHHLFSGPLYNADQIDLWGAGQTGKPWLRWLQQRGVRVRRLFDVSPKKIGQRIHGVRVFHGDDIPRADHVPLIIAVGADQARQQIRDHIFPLGYVAGQNAWFVA